MNMYEVCAKFGHVGRHYYIEKTVAIRANSAKEAAALVREMPRVKHHHKDAIRYVNKIDEERYLSILKERAEDPYMHCSNVQDQRRRCSLEKIPEAEEFKRKHREKPGRKCFYRKQELRNPRKYILNYISFEEYIS